MTDIIEHTEQVRRHYAPVGLVDRLRRALEVFGPENQILTPMQLASMDHFHTRGVAATADLARRAAIAPEDRVLDIGSGIGGPARFLAATIGCRVVGIDLSPEFTDAAHYLTQRTGQSDRVRVETGDATALPFDDEAFDVALLQHVAMNVADRATLYAEVRRVLVPGGRFGTYDIVRLAGEPDYPVPWARTPETSFLLDAEATRAAIEAAGFRALVWQDDSAAAKEFFAALAHSGPPTGPTLGLVMGPDFRTLTGNLGRAISDGRVAVMTGVFEAS